MHRLPDSFLSICDVFLCGVNPSLSILLHLHLSLAAAPGFSEPQVSNCREPVPHDIQKVFLHEEIFSVILELLLQGHTLPPLYPPSYIS